MQLVNGALALSYQKTPLCFAVDGNLFGLVVYCILDIRQQNREGKPNTEHKEIRRICREVDEINAVYLSIAQIITHNPIMKDSDEKKREYLRRLNRYRKAGGFHHRKFGNAQLKACGEILSASKQCGCCHKTSFYQYYILFDLMHLLAYEFKSIRAEKLALIRKKYDCDFKESSDQRIVDGIFRVFEKGGKELKRLLKEPALSGERAYIELLNKNIEFSKMEPSVVMVTATMSAGKSTLINAVAGKYICLSQVLACTSKIHSIVNKAFEDGCCSKYDHELLLDTNREELVNNHELNASDKIAVGTHFTGELSDQRIIINDSPGVNYSMDESHRLLAERLIKAKKYRLLVYIMNATQLSTNDESGHLDFVKKNAGKKPVLFLINKIDKFNMEEEDLEAAIRKQAAFLEAKGFKNPMVCPVSAKAGYLAKQYMAGRLLGADERELYYYVDKFDKMGLPQYYARQFKEIKIKDSRQEEVQLLKTCGLAYVEKLITAFTGGGNANGAGVR